MIDWFLEEDLKVTNINYDSMSKKVAGWCSWGPIVWHIRTVELIISNLKDGKTVRYTLQVKIGDNQTHRQYSLIYIGMPGDS